MATIWLGTSPGHYIIKQFLDLNEMDHPIEYNYIKDECNDTDGPISINQSIFWLQQGKLHRTNGPAIEWANGNKAWYLNDIFYSYEDWFYLLTPDQQFEMLFK